MLDGSNGSRPSASIANGSKGHTWISRWISKDIFLTTSFARAILEIVSMSCQELNLDLWNEMLKKFFRVVFFSKYFICTDDHLTICFGRKIEYLARDLNQPSLDEHNWAMLLPFKIRGSSWSKYAGLEQV